MLFFSKLFKKSRKDISRESALSEMSSLAHIAVFICRIGGFITGLWAALCISAIAVALFCSITGAVGQLASNGDGGIVYAVGNDPLLTFTVLGTNGSPIVTTALLNLFCCRAFGSAIDFFKAISKSGRPFERDRAHELQRAGSLLVLGSVISGPAGVISIILVSRLSGSALSWSITEVIPIVPLAIGIIVFVFSRILEYGCVLQEQDDALL